MSSFQDTWSINRGSSGQRFGFTMLELLVVLTIIGLLLASLIPAVRAARETARRTECISRLAMIGKAIHAFEGARQHLPVNDIPDSRQPDSLHGSVPFQLLPWLDQDVLASSLYDYRNYGPLGNDWVGPPRLSAFVCPSDSATGKLNYVFCTGWQVIGWAHPADAGAFCGFGGAVKIRDVTDGLSNTAAASERLTGSGSLDQYDPRRDIVSSGLDLVLPREEITPEVQRQVCRKLKPGLLFNPFSGRSWTFASFLGAWYNHWFPPNPDFPPCVSHPPVTVDAVPSYGPYNGIVSATSMHGELVNLLMLDGSVRQVSDTTDTHVWRATASRAGGETIPSY